MRGEFMKIEKEIIVKGKAKVDYQDTYEDNKFSRNFYLFFQGIVIPFQLENERLAYDLSSTISNNMCAFDKRTLVSFGYVTRYVKEYNQFVCYPFFEYKQFFGKEIVRVYIRFRSQLARSDYYKLVMSSSI